MSSSKIREDNECQNCGYTVDVAYCSKCGQKNTETRQPFHHLFTHFIEDLTHYDGAFWKTIKHLLFRPGKLSIEYLQGKRQTYVPPVKLYIFISFVTFFLLSIFSGDGNIEIKTQQPSGTRTAVVSNDNTDEDSGYHNGRHNFRSLRELEEHQNKATDSEKLAKLEYWLAKATLKLSEDNASNEEVMKQFIQTSPKVIFLYMPIFAFWLWLFHGKRRWYFFDHGIFTLHYFSFLLISITIFTLLIEFFNLLLPDDPTFFIACVIGILIGFYAFFYFFRSHRRMYGEKRWVSRLKSITLFFINFIALFIAIIAGMVYAILHVH